MKLLDLFCGAGGAAVGYHRAGFDEIIGVDIAPQPNYPFEFHQGDATDLGWLLGGEIGYFDFDAIHASPPCQRHSTLKTGTTGDYQDLIFETRQQLSASQLPYIIENVVGAPLINPVRLCGSTLGNVDSDGLETAYLQRHRIFESNVALVGSGCDHTLGKCLGVYGHLTVNDRCNNPKRPGHGWKAGKARARRLMGIDWEVTDRELAESIPPSFSEYLGRQLLAKIGPRW